MFVHFKDFVTQTGKKQKTFPAERLLSSFLFYRIRDDRYIINGMDASDSTVESTTVSTA